MLEIGKAVRNKKRVAVRVVSEELYKTLKEQLIAERDKYLKRIHASLANFVCTEVTIDELCSQAEYIKTCSVCLVSRVILIKDRFCNVISSVLTQMVCRKCHI